MAGQNVLYRTGPAGDRGRYVVVDAEPLAGGQGFVFLAHRDGHPDELLTLKLLGEATVEEEAGIAGKWAAVAARPHPRLVAPVELFRGPGLYQEEPPDEADSDLLYGVTEWVPGATLRGLAPLSPTQVANLVLDLAHAIEHLHSKCGLVHRDVHPGNVVIDAEGRATLIDLGAARPDLGTTTTTVEGVLGFIPPERTRGEVDRRSDAWGLGMVTIHALIGHPRGDMSERRLEDALRRSLAPSAPARDLARLLAAMTSPDPSARPTDIVGWASAVADRLDRSRRGLSKVGLAVGGLAVLVALAGVLSLVARVGGDDSSRADPDPRERCSHAVGAAPDPGSGTMAETVAAVVPGLELAASELEGPCGIEPITAFVDGAYQRLADARGEWVAFASPEAAVLLSPAEWVSYREIAGRQQPENAATFGGYPVSIEHERDGAETWLDLSEGGAVVGPRSDTQSFWMPAQVLEIWAEHGGLAGDLGLPMSNPFIADGDLRQDFAGGYLLLPAEIRLPLAAVTSGMVEVHLDPDPGSHLRGIDVRTSIVRQPTGTAWWVDSDGVRHWIPDGGTYQCLGGDEVMRANDVAGAGVAQIPLGAVARCGEGAS